ncbi:MAG: NADH-quinone oxidoreductase subunit C [Acidimicrobiaceae bacterium]|nr:NADH-quinone oxidoreductase subunit C [Acidimicrobiaceae bacterium]
MAERYGAPVGGDRPSRGQAVIHPSPSQWFEVAAAARADGFDQLIDLTAVDYLTYGADRGLPEGVQPERFEVVASLMSHERRERLRMRVQVPADDPSIPTLFDLWPGAENLEREAYDMFGIVFEGHPDPSRILMPEDWSGHPLRKDYDSGEIPVQFKAASNVR